MGYIRSDCMVLFDANGNEVSSVPTPAPGGSTGGAPTLSAYGYVKITASGTNLRDNVAGDTLTQLSRNSVWPMCGIAVTYGQYTWYPVQAEGHTGWVRGDCAFKLSASQELSYLQNGTITSETPAPTPSLSNHVITILDYVNLRASASRDAAAPFKVRTGTVMTFTGTKTVGTSLWYRVVYEGTEVWVLGTCVEVMTTAEYEQWLGSNPGAAPDANAGLGYLITVESGVNVRSTAGGSTIVARLNRGSIVPYFAEAKRVGSYGWYAIRTLDGTEVRFSGKNACCVITASAGYPESYKKGYPITMTEEARAATFVAGGKLADGRLVTSGGRVTGTTAIADTLADAIREAYRLADGVQFENSYRRSDIGQRALKA